MASPHTNYLRRLVLIYSNWYKYLLTPIEDELKHHISKILLEKIQEIESLLRDTSYIDIHSIEELKLEEIFKIDSKESQSIRIILKEDNREVVLYNLIEWIERVSKLDTHKIEYLISFG